MPPDPLQRARRRVLLFSAPLVFIFAITDRLVLRGGAFWAAFGIRVLWGASLVGAALCLPHLGPTAEGRLLTAVGFTTSAFFGVLAAMTGGMTSPLFHFIVAMPLVVAVVLQDQPRATLAAALAMLASGIVIIGRDSGAYPMIGQWLVQAAAMGTLAVYASVTYRRLRLRLEAARHAEVAASERAKLFQRELKAREEFLTVASHELKTPMTSLLLQVESLGRLSGGPDRAEIPRARLAAKQEVIVRQTHRLATLVETLLDASRIQTGRLQVIPEEADLVEVVKACVHSLEEDARQVGSRIELHDGGEGIPGRWDPRRLEQIVANLMANAVRYGPRAPIQVRLTATEQQVTISVCDHGAGIAPADHHRIFERFERIPNDKATGGLGLGLWITQQLVEAMGGRVLVSSDLGQGSTFTVELPRETNATTVGMSRAGPIRTAG